MSAELEIAIEKMLDAFLTLAEGRDDDELMFIDGALRSIAEQLGIEPFWTEIEPMTAGEFRRRYRTAKSRLAGVPEGPTPAESEKT